MPESIGPHLLGRNPSPPDERDYPLAAFLAGGDPLDAALAALQHSVFTPNAVKQWAKLATARIKALVPTPPDPTPHPIPPPEPTPIPAPTGEVVWIDNEAALDQGNTGHCVGFGSAQWGNTLPVDDHWTNDDGHKIYYECKVLDGQPNEENGSSVRSGVTALRDRGRLKTYASAASVDEIIAWITGHGPVLIGTDWTADMFTPDASGVIHPTGAVEGGHCYLAVGYHPATGMIEFQNSWGSGWGVHGRFFMHADEFASLLARDGEAWAAAELAA